MYTCDQRIIITIGNEDGGKRCDNFRQNLQTIYQMFHINFLNRELFLKNLSVLTTFNLSNHILLRFLLLCCSIDYMHVRFDEYLII